jgi:hypothetical protein
MLPPSLIHVRRRFEGKFCLHHHVKSGMDIGIRTAGPLTSHPIFNLEDHPLPSAHHLDFRLWPCQKFRLPPCWSSEINIEDCKLSHSYPEEGGRICLSNVGIRPKLARCYNTQHRNLKLHNIYRVLTKLYVAIVQKWQERFWQSKFIGHTHDAVMKTKQPKLQTD